MIIMIVIIINCKYVVLLYNFCRTKWYKNYKIFIYISVEVMVKIKVARFIWRHGVYAAIFE